MDVDVSIRIGGEAGQGMQSIGIIYKEQRPTLNEQQSAIKDTSLVKQKIDQKSFENLLETFT